MISEQVMAHVLQTDPTTSYK